MGILDPREHWGAIRELASLLTRHRELLWAMAKREIKDRYAGEILGGFWAVGHPLVLMAVYTFVFAVVLRMKADARGLSLPVDYSMYLICGLVSWLFTVEVLNKTTTSIVANAGLVKQVVFPIEILPVKSVLSSLAMPLTAFSFFTFYVLIRTGGLYWTYLLIPVLVVAQVLGLTGAGYVLSAVGTYFRDLKDFVQIFCLTNMYLTPIFYMPENMPAVFRPVLYANPFSYMIWCYQDVCYYGRFEHPWAWLVFPLLSIGVFYAGYRVFRKLKPVFGNVL